MLGNSEYRQDRTDAAHERQRSFGCWATVIVLLCLTGSAVWWYMPGEEATLEPLVFPYHPPSLTLSISDTTICADDSLVIDAHLEHSNPFFVNASYRWIFVYDSVRRVRNESGPSVSLVPTSLLRRVICEVSIDSGRTLVDTSVIRVVDVQAAYDISSRSLSGRVRSVDPYSPQWYRVLNSADNKVVMEPTDQFNLAYKSVPNGAYHLVVRDEYSSCRCTSNVVRVQSEDR
jgi:hypothetical protein